MQKVLIAYFSHSGTTKKVAEKLALLTGGELFPIRPMEPYPEGYSAVVAKAKKEVGAGARPAIQAPLPDFSKYSAMLVGYPNWWSTVPMPVLTFLEGADLAGKTVLPFYTHGGGGAGRSVGDVKKACPGALVTVGFDANGATDKRLGDWLSQVGLQ